ncbi:MAG: DNA polymerase III subunit beta [Stenomitos frigidus ULC029]
MPKTKFDPDALIAGFTMSQATLTDLLSTVGRAVPSRPSHPILANIMLVVDADKQTLTVSAFDLSLGIQRTATVFATKSGSFTLPAKLTIDMVAKLPDGDVSFAVFDFGFGKEPTDEDSTYALMAQIKVGRSAYEIPGMPSVEFPVLPELEGDATTMTLAVNEIISGLKHTLFSASSDETKQVLTGIHVSTRGAFDFASTDGHRLAAVSIDFAEGAEHEDAELTIPAKAMQEVARLAEKAMPEVVELQFNDSQAVFTWEHYRITTRLLEGQYPNYRQLIPNQFSKEMTVDRKTLVSTLERISVMSDQKNNIVRLMMSADDQLLTITVDASEVGSGTEEIPVQYSGDDLTAAFNIKYLLEGLKVLHTSEVQISLNTATSPVVVKPMGSIKSQYLVMPVQVRT